MADQMVDYLVGCSDDSMVVCLAGHWVDWMVERKVVYSVVRLVGRWALC